MKNFTKKLVATILSASLVFASCLNATAADVEMKQPMVTSEYGDDKIEILWGGRWIGDLSNQTLAYEKSTGECAVGLKRIEDKVYYFDEDGIVQSGWQKVKLEEENKEDGTEEIKEYYFSLKTGERYEKRIEVIEGVTYEFDADGNATVVEEQKEEEVPQEESLPEENLQPEINPQPESSVQPEDNSNPEMDMTPEEQPEDEILPEANEESSTAPDDPADDRADIIERMKAGWNNTAEGKIYILENGNRAVGMQTIKDAMYFFNENGILQIGWIQWNGNKYFAAADGKLYRNRQISFGKTVYCMGTDGSVQYGIANLNGTLYHTDEVTGHLIRTAGWFDKDGKRYFAAADGKLYKNQLITFGKTWYCMGEDGSVQYGVVDLKGTLYYADQSTGKVIHEAGWIVDSDTSKKYFAAADGKLYKNQLITFGKTAYCMGEDGSVQYGVVKTGGKYYYAEEVTGKIERRAGWIESLGRRYFANEKGELYHDQFISFGSNYYYCGAEAYVLTGEQIIDGVVYHMDSNGLVEKEGGWGEYNGNKYYKNPATGMPYRNQFVTFGKTWYYANTKGIMVSGWQTIQGFRYYFYPDTKIMARNTTIDGIKIGPNGRTVSAKDTLSQIYATNGVRYWNTEYKLSSNRKKRVGKCNCSFFKTWLECKFCYGRSSYRPGTYL